MNGVADHKISVSWQSITLPQTYEVRVVDVTNNTAVTRAYVNGIEDSLSIGELEACHIYTVMVVSIDEKRNRMKSKRKKVRTTGCTPDKLEIIQQGIRDNPSHYTLYTIYYIIYKPG